MNDKCPNFKLYALHTGISAGKLEYDLHMASIVNRIFADPYLKSRLMLFGGTMLCRMYNICNRPSTDLDLAYSIDTSKLSRNQVRELEKEMAVGLMTDYIEPILHPQYKCTFNADAPTMINVSYKSVIDNSIRSMDLDFKSGFWAPAGACRPFIPLIHTHTTPEQNIPSVSIEQMFWIKLAVLHCYHNMPQNKTIYPTASRHYYDVFCLIRHGVKLQDKRGKLLQNVVRTNLMPLQKRRWAKYGEMPNGVHLMPAPHIMDALRRDYAQYSANIYGERPTWPQIMSAINKLQQSL